MSKPRLLIHVNRPLLKAGFRHELSKFSHRFQCTFSTAEQELVEKLLLHEFDLLLVRVQPTSLQTIKYLLHERRKTAHFRIGILIEQSHTQILRTLLRYQIEGIFTPETSVKTLLYGLQRIAQGKHFRQQSLRGTLHRMELDLRKKEKQWERLNHELSKRESEVMPFIYQGLNTSEIAAELSVSARTAERHRQRVLQKSECKNPLELRLYLEDLKPFFDPSDQA